jgi:hypothetical protein
MSFTPEKKIKIQVLHSPFIFSATTGNALFNVAVHRRISRL